VLVATPGAPRRGGVVFVACWSSKGGAGTSVVAAGLALRYSRQSPAGAVLIDCAGDAPTVLGVPEPATPGLAEWLRTDPTGALPGITATPRLLLVPRGAGQLALERADTLASRLADDERPVVVDCGTTPGGVAAYLARRADRSLLVTRPCYLALRRHLAGPAARPTGVVVVRESGRALSPDDIASAIGVPVVAEIDLDPAVARAVDAGLLAAGRLPTALEASLAKAPALVLAAPVQDLRSDTAGAGDRVVPEASEVSAW
jgi:MinD-like ATPase involved in chromosome partitioning or flagellar assembly